MTGSAQKLARPSAGELVDAVAGSRARRAAEDAEELRTLARAKELVEGVHGPVTASSRADIAYRSLIADLAAAIRLSERTVQRWVEDAADLVSRFAAAVDALGEGRISRAHVQVIHETGAAITDDATRERFTERMVELAQDATPARLRAVARLAADRARAVTADERHRAARRARRIRVFDLDDGMAELTAILPAVLAHAVYDRATRDARSIIRARSSTPGQTDSAGTDADDHADADAHARAADADADADADAHARADSGRVLDAHAEGADPASHADERTMDEIRADVLADLLLTGSASACTAGEALDAVTAIVQITVPVLTLAGAGDEPALLAGHGPIDRATAQRLVGNAEGWDRVMTSPVDGSVLAVDRYTPSKKMTRHLRARDERCRFPGCRQPVWRCDLDHTVDHARGGARSLSNLAHLCRRHHTLKHASDWTVRQLPKGLLEWTSPSGRMYVDEPEPTVRFRALADEPAPPPEPPPF